jgi:hypothetical protein
MRVRASKNDDYQIEFRSGEFAQLKNTNKLGQLTIKNNNFTFDCYSEVPELMIMSSTFKEIEIKKTSDIESKTDFLTQLGLCVHVGSGEIIKIESILENEELIITPDHFRFVCNHIPQIFYPFNGKKIAAIDGDYEFSSGLFKGSLIFE